MFREFKITKHDIEVLEMVAGKRAFTRGAWVNAVHEDLTENGYLTRSGRMTDKGRKVLEDA